MHFLNNIKTKEKHGFTLVELIVTITILAILATIAFISFQWYAKDSRNTVRINDIKIIQKAIEIFYAENLIYPTPASSTQVTYSWWLLWYQGYFWTWTTFELWNMSKVPVDPLLSVEYSYSLLWRKNKYQLWLVYEWEYIANNNVFKKTYALSNTTAKPYVFWNYDLLDIKVTTSTWCLNVTAPSLIINNLPWDWVLTWSTYDFVYNRWLIVPSNYESVMDIDVAWFGFQIQEVYNKCYADYLSDINTYITNLSSAYQQFSWIEAYDEVANHPRTIDFLEKAITYLEKNAITVKDWLLAVLNNVYIDTFSGLDNDILVQDHSSDTLWTWEFMSPSSDSWSYIIYNNRLEKDNVSFDIIKPILISPKTSANTTVSLKVVNFNGWYLTIYWRYQNASNYYSVTLNSSWYVVNKVIWWSSTPLADVTSPISNNSNIQFVLSWDNIKLIINWIEVENRVDTDISAIWEDAIFMNTSWMVLDDYILYY